jgi:hypothetical protein
MLVVRVLHKPHHNTVVSFCLLQVSLCDDYSLPVDFVNKRRPHSFGAGLANWTTPSPNGEQVRGHSLYKLLHCSAESVIPMNKTALTFRIVLTIWLIGFINLERLCLN